MDLIDSSWSDLKAEKRTSRIGIFFFAIAALLVLSICLIYWMERGTDQKRGQVAARERTIDRLNVVLSTLKDAETGQRGYLLTLSQSYLEPFDSAQDRIKEDLRQMTGSLVAEQEESPNFSELINLIPQKLDELNRTVDLARQGHMDQALAIVRADQGKNLMDQIRLNVAKIREDEDRAVERAERSVYWTDIERDLLICTLVITNLAFLVWAYRKIRGEEKARNEAITITERQRELLKVTLISIGDAVIVTDVEGRITLMNPVAEELTGWSFEQAKGNPCQTIFRIINEETRQTVESPVTKVMREGVIVGLANHTFLIRRDGTEIPIDDSGAPIRAANGNLRGVVLIFRDFTVHKIAEEKLRRAADDLALANHAKDTFLATVSHELRTPLNAILGWIGVMNDSPHDQNIQSQGVEVVKRNAITMSKLISDLLDVSRITSGTLSLEFGQVDLVHLVTTAIQTSVLEANNKKITLVSGLEEKEGIIVWGDQIRLGQVLGNLLGNALKFTPEGGVISIRLREELKTAVLEIEDSGIGIEADFLPRVFEAFAQGQSTSDRDRGMGLGLSISKSLVELHHGSIEVESNGVGAGTKFTVILPLIQSGHASMANPNWST